MRLRLATHDDVAFLVRVVLETVSAHGSDSEDVTATASGSGHAERARERIASDVEAGDTYVIELAGDRVGRLRVVRTADCLDLTGLQILPRFQSQGIGSAVIQTLMEEALTSGKILELGVMTSNQRARGLYERLGFREVGTDNSEVRMRWVSGVRKGHRGEVASPQRWIAPQLHAEARASARSRSHCRRL